MDKQKGGPTGRGVYAHELMEQYLKNHGKYNDTSKDDPQSMEDFKWAHQLSILIENGVNESVRIKERTYKNKNGSLTTYSVSHDKNGVMIVTKVTKPAPSKK
jgi:hypothetical protein